jgi:formate dehydrogenase formation protein
MPDYAALMADWEALLARRPALAEPLGFWTAILEGWAAWKLPASLMPLVLSPEDCRQRWQAGRSLLADAALEIPAASVEDLLGPVMERLAADGPEAAAALRRFAEAWDEGQADPAALLPSLDGDPTTTLQERFGLGSHLGAFLPVAALRPALETYFEGVRGLPAGVWTRGGCPWCGGAPSYGDLVEDGRRRLSCHVCGGAWIAARLRCPFCESWNAKDLVRLVAEELDEGYFIEACRACEGYLKGVDRRQRWNAGGPLVEDWGSPHLDLYAAREGYWRSTPSLAHLLPPEGPEEEIRA